jgi:hypothetical protein
MAGTRQRDERNQQQPTSPSTSVITPAERDRARALLLTGLAWAVVVLLSWLSWWLLGEGGREALARTVGLSAGELTPYVLASLVAEKVAAKGLLFAALYHWLRDHEGRPEA